MERPDLRPRLRARYVAITVFVLAGVVANVVLALRPAEPRFVAVQATPAATVTVPAPIVNVSVAPPPAPAPLADPPIAEPRPLVPHLDAGCLLPAAMDGAPTEPSPCGWDSGFPAVSADGTLVAVVRVQTTPMDGSATDMWIDLLDRRTSRAVRQLGLFTSADLGLDRSSALAKVTVRVASAQRVLESHQFKTMIALGDSRSEVQPVDATHVHAEFRDGRARIVAPRAATVLWQGEPGVAPPPGLAGPHAEAAECAGWNLHSTQLWWHPDAKVVFAQLRYFSGGCMCPDYTEMQTWRLPSR